MEKPITPIAPENYPRRSFSIEELSEEEIEEIAASRMDPKYDYLNALLDE